MKKALMHTLLFLILFFGTIIMLPGLITMPKKSWRIITEGYRAKRKDIKEGRDIF